MSMSIFVFPFTTCECVSEGGVAQPHSAVVNMITCLTLLGFMFIAKTRPVQILLGTYALFEAWHAFSHIKHIAGNVQTNVVHVLGYIMSFATLYAIIHLSKGTLSTLVLAIICLAILLDIYVWIYVKSVWTVFTGLLVFAVVVFGNYDKLPQSFKVCIPYLIVGLLLLFGLFINETYNCERMMRYKVLPYHVLIEILGFILFITIAVLFLKWEQENI